MNDLTKNNLQRDKYSMKTKNRMALIILAIMIFNFEGISFAREHSSRRVASDAEVTVSETKRFGLGFATLQSVIPGSSAGLIAGVVEFDKLNSITLLLSLPTTSPFALGVGGLYKHTVSGSQAAGFHVGGGIGIGNITALNTSYLGFGLNILGGFHFEVPGAPQVSVSFDGGPSFNLIASTPSQTNFQVSAFSPALGASIIYLF